MPLGKSLGNILGDYFGQETVNLGNASEIQIPSNSITLNIPIQEIKFNPFQTRTIFDFEKIQSLAQNIKENGLIQPIVVISYHSPETQKQEYILLAGERRLRACKLLGWEEILAVVRPQDSLTDSQQAMLSAMENLQREDLSPIELASTFKMLKETQNLDESALAEMLGNSVQYVKNYLRLLSLTPMVQQALLDKVIGEGQARHLVGLEDSRQKEVLAQIIAGDLTVKEIIALLKKDAGSVPTPETIEIVNKFHNLKPETVLKANRLAAEFPNARVKCVGDEKAGKIIISWKDK